MWLLPLNLFIYLLPYFSDLITWKTLASLNNNLTIVKEEIHVCLGRKLEPWNREHTHLGIQWEEMPLPLRSSWKDGESSISALTRSPNGTSEPSMFKLENVQHPHLPNVSEKTTLKAGHAKFTTIYWKYLLLSFSVKFYYSFYYVFFCCLQFLCCD